MQLLIVIYMHLRIAYTTALAHDQIDKYMHPYFTHRHENITQAWKHAQMQMYMLNEMMTHDGINDST